MYKIFIKRKSSLDKDAYRARMPVFDMGNGAVMRLFPGRSEVITALQYEAIKQQIAALADRVSVQSLCPEPLTLPEVIEMPTPVAQPAVIEREVEKVSIEDNDMLAVPPSEEAPSADEPDAVDDGEGEGEAAEAESDVDGDSPAPAQKRRGRRSRGART